MTRERAAELLSEVTVLDDPEMAEAHRVAISALRQQEHFREVTKKVEPLTNAQKIRAMSDEELAVLIAREIVHVPHSGFYVAKSAWLRWLHETVEEQDG